MKHTKRLSALLLTLLLILTGLCACGQSEPEPVKEPPVLSAVGKELDAALGLTGMMELTAAEAADYIGTAEEDVAELYAEIAEESIQADLICLFQGKDEAAAGRIRDCLSAYLSQQANAMKNYLPDEYAKLENTDVKTSGLYVIAVVGKDRTKIDEILKKYF